MTSWESQTNAFKSVVKHSPSGKALDVVVAAAGVVSGPLILPGEEPPGLENGPLEPQIGPLMVNTVGVLYTTQLARYYLRLPSPSNETSTSTKALILFGSTACYFGAPMAATYNASKHGARGLFHSVREPLAKQGVRINMMCPWIMPTPMTTGWILTFTEAGLPISKVEDVVIAVTRCAVDESICGKASSTVFLMWLLLAESNIYALQDVRLSMALVATSICATMKKASMERDSCSSTLRKRCRATMKKWGRSCQHLLA